MFDQENIAIIQVLYTRFSQRKSGGVNVSTYLVVRALQSNTFYLGVEGFCISNGRVQGKSRLIFQENKPSCLGVYTAITRFASCSCREDLPFLDWDVPRYERTATRAENILPGQR